MKYALFLFAVIIASDPRAQALSVSPSILGWSKVTPGQHPTATFSITNNSSSTASGTFENVRPPFSVLEGSSFTLQPQERQNYTVQFYPVDSNGGADLDTMIVRSAVGTGHTIKIIPTSINIYKRHIWGTPASLTFPSAT